MVRNLWAPCYFFVNRSLALDYLKKCNDCVSIDGFELHDVVLCMV